MGDVPNVLARAVAVFILAAACAPAATVLAPPVLHSKDRDDDGPSAPHSQPDLSHRLDLLLRGASARFVAHVAPWRGGDCEVRVAESGEAALECSYRYRDSERARNGFEVMAKDLRFHLSAVTFHHEFGVATSGGCARQRVRGYAPRHKALIDLEVYESACPSPRSVRFIIRAVNGPWKGDFLQQAAEIRG